MAEHEAASQVAQGWHWPTVSAISVLASTVGALVFRGGSKMRAIDEAMAARIAAEARMTAEMQLLREELKTALRQEELRSELKVALRERDEELREIRGLIQQTLERLHGRVDELAGAVRGLEGYLKGVATREKHAGAGG